MNGILYVCPTPIGNLEDITLRVIRILGSVDLIAAEDTRQTLKLLNHLEIKCKLVSYHEHNKMTAGEKLIELLKSGTSIALVTDAGMPGISDPGQDLVQRCIEEEIKFEVLPGPSAFVNALVMSGLDTSRFHFYGFLDRHKKKRKEELESLRYNQETLIFYESPHRLKATLKDLSELFADRKVAVVREITKKFEETIRGTAIDVYNELSDREIKGEIVLLMEGGEEEIIENPFDNLSIKEHLVMLIDEGVSKKEAIKQVAKERDLPKREVYAEAIDL